MVEDMNREVSPVGWIHLAYAYGSPNMSIHGALSIFQCYFGMGVLQQKDGQLTHYQVNYFLWRSLLAYTYHIRSSVGFSAPKFHISAIAVILYTSVTQTTTPINELAIVTTLS